MRSTVVQLALWVVVTYLPGDHRVVIAGLTRNLEAHRVIADILIPWNGWLPLDRRGGRFGFHGSAESDHHGKLDTPNASVH